MIFGKKIPHASERTKRIGLLFIIVGCFINNYIIFLSLLNDYNSLEVKLEKEMQTVSLFQENLYKERNKSSSLESNLKAEKETVNQIQNQFQNQIQTISSTVGVLEKLSKTDEELLKKYSKVYFLNENYTPLTLSIVDPKYGLQNDKTYIVHSEVLPFLTRMLEDSTSAGLSIKILSAYRSFSEQQSLKSNYRVTYGSGANKFSADQGYSEHQLGTTLDLTTTKIGAVLTGFEKTPEYNWLINNAYKYGFVLSYPKENSFYIFEPWHWRFVGVSLATKLHNQNLYFYALDQRDIDAYLIHLFD